jgi:two-component system phosphate regulon response regulator PhoB
VRRGSTVPGALRNIVFRFAGSPLFARALHQGDQELALPTDESVGDGEWGLAIFAVGEGKRATASAARGLVRGPPSPPMLAFERRDWDRLVDFAAAGSGRMVAAASAAAPSSRPPPPPAVGVESAAAQSIGRTKAWPSAPDSKEVHGERPARVLVVDDDRDVCALVAKMLDAHGLAVDTVASAEEALHLILADRCDLVVLDWKLPGMAGIDLCKAIRKDAARSALPVLFLSARSSTQDIVDAFASGADDYVTKPFRAPELGARIFNLLRRARRMSASP